MANYFENERNLKRNSEPSMSRSSRNRSHNDSHKMHDLSRSRMNQRGSQSRRMQSNREETIRPQARKNISQKRVAKSNGQTLKNMTIGLPTGRIELAAVTFVLFIVMWFLGWQLLPFNKVNYITVSGVQFSQADHIAFASAIRPLDTVKDVMKKREQIEAAIKGDNPVVSSIVLDRPSWTQLEIKVTEHNVIAKIESSGNQKVLLENGELVDINNENVIDINKWQDYPIILEADKKGKLVTIASALRRINPEVLKLIDTIQVSNEVNNANSIVLKMKDGLLVRAIATTLSEKINKYPQMKAIIADQKGVLNLEVGAYFTPEQNFANSVKLDTNIDN